MRTMLSFLIFFPQLRLSTSLFEYVNDSIAPCDDFYEYACGKFHQWHPLSGDFSYKNFDTFLRSERSTVLKELLQPDITPTDTELVKAAKALYASCIEVEGTEDQSLDTLVDIIDSFGDFPILLGDCWEENDFDWVELGLKTFHELAFFPFLAIDDAPNSNYKRNILRVKEDALALGNKKFYVDPRYQHILDSYRKFNIEIAGHFDVYSEIAKRDVERYIDLETKLAKLLVDEANVIGPDKVDDYEVTTLDNIIALYPEIPLLRLFRDLSDSGWDYNVYQDVAHQNPYYLNHLMGILRETPKRDLANYIMFRIINKFSTALNPKLRHNYRPFFVMVYQIDETTERSEECLKAVVNQFPWVVSSMYVKRNGNHEHVTEIWEMISYIQNSILNAISTSNWINSRRKVHAFSKLSHLSAVVGYPTFLENEAELTAKSLTVVLDKDDYLLNYKKLYKARFAKFLRVLTLPYNEMDDNYKYWPVALSQTYSQLYNRIILPAASLQFPSYVAGASRYVNYGRIGTIIAHEITHALTNDGDVARLDPDGMVTFLADIARADKKKEQCFIDQYSNIIEPVTGLNLNGKMEFNENVCDNVGIVHAYQAYRNWRSQRPSAETTPLHLENYSVDQLFFLNYAQLRCENISPELLKQRILSDSHAPLRYRVNVPLQNFEEFSEAFNCPKGSPMNPETKCRLL